MISARCQCTDSWHAHQARTVLRHSVNGLTVSDSVLFGLVTQLPLEREYDFLR